MTAEADLSSTPEAEPASTSDQETETESEDKTADSAEPEPFEEQTDASKQEPLEEQTDASQQEPPEEQTDTSQQGLSAEQASTSAPGPEDTSPPVLVSTVYIIGKDTLLNIPAVTVWENDYDDLLYIMLDYQTVEAKAVSPTGEEEPLTLTVDWNPSALTTDFSVPGEYQETAPILLPGAEYVFAEGEPQSVAIPVIVGAGAPPPEVITVVSDVSRSKAYAISKDAVWNEFFSEYFDPAQWTNYIPCITEAGEEAYAHIVWTDPQPTPGETSVVRVAGSLVLPENTVLGEAVQVPEIFMEISVQDPERPALDTWYISAGNINLPWFSDSVWDYENEPVVLLRKDGGEWVEEYDNFWCDNEAAHLSMTALEDGAYYEVKVVWNGGETGIFHFTYDGTVTDAGYMEGDRDGGDAGGNPPSNVIQLPPATDIEEETDREQSPDAEPEPDPEQEPGAEAETDREPELDEETEPDAEAEPAEEPGSDTEQEPGAEQKPDEEIETPPATAPEKPDDATPVFSESGSLEETEPFFEEDTDTYSLLSGARLALMMQNGPVRFSKQGVTATLSEVFLDYLALTDDSQFYIELQKTENGFSLKVEADGKSISELPDTVILLPYTRNGGDHTALVLTDEAGDVVSQGSYDADLGVASFTVQKAGTYLVETTSTPEPPVQEAAIIEDDLSSSTGQNGLPPAAVIAIVVAVPLALCAVVVVRRRWRR